MAGAVRLASLEPEDRSSALLDRLEGAEVRAGLAEIERGDIASADEVRAVYKRIGL